MKGKLSFIILFLAFMLSLTVHALPTDSITYSGQGAFMNRTGSAMAELDGWLYLLGGMRTVPSTNYSKEVWKSHDGTAWSQVAATGFPGIADSTAAVLNGCIYLATGFEETNNSAVKHVWKSCDGTTWSLLATTGIDSGLRYSCMLSKGSQLFLIGGINAAGAYTGKTYSSWDGIAWTSEDTQIYNTTLAYHACATFNGRLYILGGRRNGTSTSLNQYVYSSATGANWAIDAWFTGGFYPYAQQAVNYQNLYIMGVARNISSNDFRYYRIDPRSALTPDYTSLTSPGTSPGFEYATAWYDNRQWFVSGRQWDSTAGRDIYYSAASGETNNYPELVSYHTTTGTPNCPGAHQTLNGLVTSDFEDDAVYACIESYAGAADCDNMSQYSLASNYSYEYATSNVTGGYSDIIHLSDSFHMGLNMSASFAHAYDVYTTACWASGQGSQNISVISGCDETVYSARVDTGTPTCVNSSITITVNHTKCEPIVLAVDCYGDGAQSTQTNLTYTPTITCLMNRTGAYAMRLTVFKNGQTYANPEYDQTVPGETVAGAYPDCFTSGLGADTINNPDANLTDIAALALSPEDALVGIFKGLGFKTTGAMTFLGLAILGALAVFLAMRGTGIGVIIVVLLLGLIGEVMIGLIPFWILVVLGVLGAIAVFLKITAGGGGGGGNGE